MPRQKETQQARSARAVCSSPAQAMVDASPKGEWSMRRLILVVSLLAMSACASQTMRRYMGQPVQAAIARNGPPTNAFDMPDGRRAFQWSRSGQFTTPVQASNSGNIYAAGNAAWWTQNTTITGGQPINVSCHYTVYARWNASANAWIMETFEPIPYQCE